MAPLTALILTIVLVGLAVVYLFKGLGFLAGLSRLKEGAGRSRGRVSVILAARNEEGTIAACLEALLRQSYPREDYEVIVVDDQSTDGTAQIIESYGRQYDNVSLLRLPAVDQGWSHKKYGLTRAIERSSGQVIMTTDADCLVGPGWIEGMMACFEDGVGMVVGFSQIGAPGEGGSLFDRLQAVDFLALMSAAAGTIGAGLPLAASGQNLAYRKRAFEEVGGFKGIKSRVSGDDVLLLQLIATRTDWQVRFAAAPETFVTTRPVRSLRDFLEQRRRWASNSACQWKLNRGFFAYLLSTFTFNLLLCITLPLSFFVDQVRFIPWLCFLIKAGVDLSVLARGARRFGRQDLLTIVPLWEILQLPGLVIAGIAGTLGRFTWKERTYIGQGL